MSNRTVNKVRTGKIKHQMDSPLDVFRKQIEAEWFANTPEEKTMYHLLTEDEIASLQVGDKLWARTARKQPMTEVELMSVIGDVCKTVECRDGLTPGDYFRFIHQVDKRRLMYCSFEREDMVCGGQEYEV
jgi:hypothetical protein